MQVDSLLDWIRDNKRHWRGQKEEERSFRKISQFLEALMGLDLELLDLNRSIPSLSGGELQRLRLAKAVNSHFCNFLYVLDEPTSGLHPGEWPAIADVVARLSKRDNTYNCGQFEEMAAAGFSGTHNYGITAGEAADPINPNDAHLKDLLDRSWRPGCA